MIALLLSSTLVTQVMNCSGRNPLVPFFEENSLAMLIDTFACGIHRVLFFKSSYAITATVSQTDALRYVYDMLKGTPALQERGKRTVRELGLIKARPPICVSKSESVLSAAKVLAEKKVSGVAVVDEVSAFVLLFE